MAMQSIRRMENHSADNGLRPHPPYEADT